MLESIRPIAHEGFWRVERRVLPKLYKVLYSYKVRSGYLVRNINILKQYTLFQYWLGAMSLYGVNVAKTEKRMFRVQGERAAKSIHVFVLQRLEHNLMKHGI